MSTKGSCKNCGSFELESDPCRGDTVCTNCGVVLEDSIIISEVQFEENAHGGSSAIGQFVSSDAKSAAMTVVGSYTYGLQKESKEITIQKAKVELSRMCQQLRLVSSERLIHSKINNHCLETALSFYKMALNGHLTKGRRSSLVCAACLYIACRLEKTPHLLIDFSDVLQVDPFTLGRTFTNITQALYITLPLIDPCLYVLRYANQMNLGEKTQEVCTTALRVLTRMKTDFLHCGRRPSGLCGSALIIAARFHNIRKKLKDIVNIVHIQEVTLKKRLMEFGETPSSSLTTDEFLSVDLGEEQDPPSFKAARQKDKERLQQFTDVQYEMKMKKLQRLIEKELEKKRTKGKRNSSVCSHGEDSSSTVVVAAGKSKSIDESKSLLADIMKNNIEGESEIVQAVVDSTIETIDNVCTRLSERSSHLGGGDIASKGIGPTLETIGIDSTISEPSVTVSIDKKEGKCKEAENNCTLLVDNTSLEDLDEEELDSYIVTEEQFRQKEEAWLRLNQVYLEEQKRKEEERQNKEKEEGKPDRKRKRQRKQKSGSAATAGEAAEKVLREKKISNKLNYDVLKSLNMDDFVKSMKFENQFSENGTEDVEETPTAAAVARKTVSKPVAATSSPERVNDEEQMIEHEDEYDDADDFDEEQDNDDGSSLSVCNILRGEYVDDEDYDEEYDL